MALSRTARILIAVLLLAAAGFFWLNFFQQNDPVEASPTPAATPATTPATTAPGVASPLTGAPVPPTGTTVNGIVTTPEETPATGGVASTDAGTPAA
ncbi:MAG: hypothetical protein WCY60_08135, partial [Trueperaceae bacterium]